MLEQTFYKLKTQRNKRKNRIIMEREVRRNVYRAPEVINSWLNQKNAFLLYSFLTTIIQDKLTLMNVRVLTYMEVKYMIRTQKSWVYKWKYTVMTFLLSPSNDGIP